MKKLNYSIGALTLILSAVIFLSSCSSVSLSQRRYNKGLHIEWVTSQKTDKKVESNKTQRTAQHSEVITLSSLNIGTLASNHSQISNPMIDHNFILKQNKINPVKVWKSAKQLKKMTEFNEFASTKVVSKTTFLKAKKSFSKSSLLDDTNLILLVILAILIPPLAVYLHEGEINNKFIINLILTLLCGIPGVIHALIVVLGK